MNMTRKKRLVSLALDPELIRRLESWQASQDFAPTKTAVIEHALRQFLDAKEPARVSLRRPPNDS
tara:strand:- start:24 stop:218 length:195 start_codon:yes stop_codon:yes gene_type:complete